MTMPITMRSSPDPATPIRCMALIGTASRRIMRRSDSETPPFSSVPLQTRGPETELIAVGSRCALTPASLHSLWGNCNVKCRQPFTEVQCCWQISTASRPVTPFLGKYLGMPMIGEYSAPVSTHRNALGTNVFGPNLTYRFLSMLSQHWNGPETKPILAFCSMAKAS